MISRFTGKQVNNQKTIHMEYKPLLCIGALLQSSPLL